MIYGITDAVKPEFKKIGELMKGGEKKPNSPGQDLTYFRIKSENQEVVKRFVKLFGDKPNAISFYLPYGTDYVKRDITGNITNYVPVLERNFESWRMHHEGSTLMTVCNGRHVVRQRIGAYVRDVAPGTVQCTWPQCGCKAKAWLYMIIPELFYEFGGIISVRTQSEEYDIKTLYAQLELVKQQMDELGYPINRPKLILQRVPTRTSSGVGKFAHKVRWMLNISIAPDWLKDEAEKRGLRSGTDLFLMSNAPKLSAPSVPTLPAPNTPALPSSAPNTPALPSSAEFATAMYAPPTKEEPKALPDGQQKEPPSTKSTKSINEQKDAFMKKLGGIYGRYKVDENGSKERAYFMTKEQMLGFLRNAGLAYNPSKEQEIIDYLERTQEGCVIAVNNEIGVEHYKHPLHLLNAVKLELPAVKGFPVTGGDKDDWDTIKALAVEHYKKQQNAATSANEIAESLLLEEGNTPEIAEDDIPY